MLTRDNPARSGAYALAASLLANGFAADARRGSRLMRGAAKVTDSRESHPGPANLKPHGGVYSSGP